MTLTPYVKTALAALILPIFYHPSLHVYEPSGKSFLDVAVGSAVAPDIIVPGKGPKARAGFTASATINRHDFGVSWNSTLDRGGVVVGNMVEITIDAEAILEEECSCTASVGKRGNLRCGS